MERLSSNPFPLSRLSPSESLPFTVPDDIVTNLTGQTLTQLQQSGHLFLVDYSFLSRLALPPGKYAAGCTAYFYNHPTASEFLPLAIHMQTNSGSDLVYTPLDSFND